MATGFGLEVARAAALAAMTAAMLIDFFRKSTSLVSEMQTAMQEVLAQHDANEQMGRLRWGSQLLWESRSCPLKGALRKCREADGVLGESIQVVYAHLTGGVPWSRHHVRLYLIMQAAMCTRLLALHLQRDLDPKNPDRMHLRGIEDTMVMYFGQLNKLVPKYIDFRMSNISVVRRNPFSCAESQTVSYDWFLLDKLTGQECEMFNRRDKMVTKYKQAYLEVLQNKYTASLDVPWLDSTA